MARKLEVEFVGDTRSLERAFKSAGASGSKFGSSLATLGKVAAVGLGAVAVGAIAAGKKMVSMASDAAEVDSKLAVVFGKELPKLSKNLDAFSEATGTSRYQMREQAADMGALLAPMLGSKKGAADMSEQFVKLATDLGSFNNVPVDEALLAIRSGLVGESEPLRAFGVLINEAAVKAEAYRAGIAKVGTELTEQQKVQARANLIMQQTQLAQGDATRTAGSMANQMKALRNNVTDMATSLGTLLIPYALAVAKAFNENWPQIEAVVRGVLTGIIEGIKGVVTAVDWLRQQWEIHRESAVAAWKAVQSAVLSTINWFKANVVPGIQNVISAATAIWENFGGEIKAIGGRIVATVQAFLQNMIAPFKIFFALLRGDWSAAWNEVKATVARTLGAAVANIKALLSAAASVAGTLAAKIGKAIIDGIVGALSGIAGKVAEKMQAVWDNIKTAATTAYNFALDIGKNMVKGIIDGFTSLIGDAKDKIVGGVKGIGSAIGGALGIGSPSRVYAETIGRPMAEGIALGFAKALAELSPSAKDKARKFIGEANDILDTVRARGYDLGNKQVQAVIDGVIGKKETLKQQLLTALNEANTAAIARIVAAKQQWADAWGQLAQAGVSAIQAKFATQLAAAIDPLQKKLDAINLREAKKQILDGIKEANEAFKAATADVQKYQDQLNALAAAEQMLSGGATVAQAIAALPAELQKAFEGLSPEEAAAKLKELQDATLKSLTDANKAVEDAKEQQRLAAVAKEKFDLEQQIARKQQHFATLEQQAIDSFKRQLNAIMEWMAKHKDQWDEGQKKIVQLFNKYGAKYRNAGAILGNEFAKGIKDGIAAVGSAVDELAEAIAAKLKGKSPPKEGPLKDIDKWGINLAKTFLEGWDVGMRRYGPSTIGNESYWSDLLSKAKGGSGVGDITMGGDLASSGEQSAGIRPEWANWDVWQSAVNMAASIGKLGDLLSNIAPEGSIASNARLLDLMFQNRTRQNWNVPSARVRGMLDLMKSNGLSGSDIAQMYGLAKGGIVTKPTWRLFGEAGPEAVVPLDRFMGGFARPVVNVYVAGSVRSERELTDAVYDGLLRLQRKNRRLQFS